jgi:arylsulfatase A-like enzyme
MERLAGSGMKFTQAYACPVCSPSRISLMTGLNAARHRVTNWTLFRDRSTDAPHPTLDMPAWNVNGLSAEAGLQQAVYARPLPAMLKELGYHAIHVGKAHLGALQTPGADPRNLGFDINIAGHAAGGPGSYLGTQNFSGVWRGADSTWDVPGLDQYHGQDIFLTEALTREALRVVDTALSDARPFFLHMSHYAVHVPYAEDSRFYGRYLRAGLDATEAMYAAIVEGMDKSLGDLLDLLDRRGAAQRTVFLFVSDNGGLSAQGRGGEPHTQNRPLSSGKGSAHEGGIRVPMIVRWPGITQPGSTCPAPVIIEDFFPTILELAGAGNRASTVDGRSFRHLLQGGAAPGSRPLYWHYPNHWGPQGPGIGPFSAIRSGDWKLIYYHASRSYELFNVEEDLGETRDLSSDQPHLVRDLGEHLRSYLLSVEAQMPVERSSGQAVPLPGEPAT